MQALCRCSVSRCSFPLHPASRLAHVPRSGAFSTPHKHETAAPLPSAASDGAPAAPDSNAQALLATPDQQVPAFTGLAAVHAGLAAAITVLPDWSMQHLLGLTPTPATSMQLLIAPGAYLWLIVACLLCLKDAAVHNRLGSDTYKRLCLGVMYQCIVFIVLLLRSKALLAGSVVGGAAAVLAATAVVTGRVYAASVGGFSLPTIVRSFLGNVKDLFSPKNISSAFYALCAALAMYQFFWQFPTPGTPLFLADEGLAAVMLKQARGGGMLLAGVVWYTLKDAADRGRLATSTFKQLNLGMAVVAAVQVAGYYKISAAGVPCVPHLYRMLISTGLLTIVVCDYHFFFAKKKKE